MTLYLFPSFFYYFLSLTEYLVFNIFYMYIMFLCSIYIQNLQQAVYVFCKFCVLCCLVLFTFIFNLFVTNESMHIVIMMKTKVVHIAFTYILLTLMYFDLECKILVKIPGSLLDYAIALPGKEDDIVRRTL